MADRSTKPLLFSPLTIRGTTIRNRTVVSPMCQYSAEDGLANAWHMVHLGQMATGGAGLVFTEAAAVEARGRITHGDLGLWSDAHVEALKPIVDFVGAHGATPGIQLAHAGRKASMQRPWFGNGPLDETDRARGDEPWEIVAPVAEPVGSGWLMPHALTTAEVELLVEGWARAAKRALAAGFEVIEIHGAHGYLIHEFLSPLCNTRNDKYGGDRQGRMRFLMEVIDAVRSEWPADKPLFLRISSIDAAENGWTIEDSVALAAAVKDRGVDVIDCSSGGIAGAVTAQLVPRNPGFQVPFAAQIREETGVLTQAVGLILDGPQAEDVLQSGGADLIAVGREALYNPHWPHHAARALGADPEYEAWPAQYGWWLTRRQKVIDLSREAGLMP